MIVERKIIVLVALGLSLQMPAFFVHAGESCAKTRQGEMLSALVDYDDKKVERILKACPQFVWAANDAGQTVVILAVLLSNQKVLEKVIKFTEEVIQQSQIVNKLLFAPDNNGVGPLDMAVYLNDKDKVISLLKVMCAEKKCQVAKGFRNPINIAVVYNNVELVEAFVKYGFPADGFSIYDIAPAKLAHRLNRQSIARELGDIGNDKNKDLTKLLDSRYGFGSFGSY